MISVQARRSTLLRGVAKSAVLVQVTVIRLVLKKLYTHMHLEITLIFKWREHLVFFQHMFYHGWKEKKSNWRPEYHHSEQSGTTAYDSEKIILKNTNTIVCLVCCVILGQRVLYHGRVILD